MSRATPALTMALMRESRRWITGLFLSLVSCSTPPAMAPMIERATPPNLRTPPPPAELVGTAQPGDVYSLTISGSRFSLVNDEGTVNVPGDDLRISGDVGPRDGASPFTLTVRGGAVSLVPDGTVIKALALPGFGYALDLNGTIVTAIEPATCAESSAILSRWRTRSSSPSQGELLAITDVAPGVVWESRRPLPLAGRGFYGPFVGSPTPALQLGFGRAADPDSLRWLAVISPCEGAAVTTSVGLLSTPLGREVAAGTAMFAYRSPDAAQTTARFTKSGALFMDLGRQFGAIAAAPLEDPSTAPLRIERLRTRLLSRTLVGYLSNVSLFQGPGANREDPTIERRSLSRTMAVRIDVTGNGGSMQLTSTVGTPIGAAIPVTVTIGTDGLLSIGAGNVSGETEFRGITIDNDQGSSFLLSANDLRSESTSPPAATAFEMAVAIPSPAGMELFRRSYTMHLRMSTPNNCFAPSTTLPAEYSDNVAHAVPMVSQPRLMALGIEFNGTSVTARIRQWADEAHSGAPVVRDISSERRYALIAPSTPVEISATAGRRVRLLCGPEYPWGPGTDVFGAVDGVQSAAMGNLGFVVPGIYVIESSPAGATPGAQSQYYVIEVQERPT
ncbi:MAG: hypothetical protein U0269_06715 [Polyangiales bacterium]